MDAPGADSLPGIVIYVSVAAVSLTATAIVLLLRRRKDRP